MTARPFAVLWTREAKKQFAGISGRRLQEGIVRRVAELAVDPEKQGKPLVADLAGYRSVRAVGRRHRIICEIERARVIVIVVALGLRSSGSGKEIYALAQRLVRLRLLGPV